MITCAKRQLLRHRPQTLNAQQTLDQLQLPWLCPALLEFSNGIRSTSTAARRRIPLASLPEPAYACARRENPGPSKAQNRNYAYATAPQQPFYQEDTYIPFESLHGARAPDVYPATAWQERPDFTKIQFDPSSPLIIKDSLSLPTTIFRSNDGIGGEPLEMYETLLACLHVGRFDRASAVLRRLSAAFKPGVPELIEIHNEYLVHLIEKVVITKDQSLLQEAQTWYTREVRAQNILPNSITIAYMIRASLQQLDLSTLPQTVSQHMHLAERQGFAGEVCEILEKTLSVSEFEQIHNILPLDSSFKPSNLPQQPKLDAPEAAKSEAETLAVPVTAEQPALTKAELMPTKQKGLGLESLLESLSLFHEMGDGLLPPAINSKEVSEEHRQAINLARQQRLERDTLQAAIRRWRLEHAEQRKELGASTHLYNLGGLVWQWYDTLVPLVKEEIQKANEAESTLAKGTVELNRVAYGPFLQYIPPETITATTILTILSALSVARRKSVCTIQSLFQRLGNAIADESLVQAIRNRTSDSRERRRFDNLTNSKKLVEMRRKYSKAKEQYLQDPMATWTTMTKHKVAALLLSLFFKAARIAVTRVHPQTGEEVTETQPAVFTTYFYKGGKRIGSLKGNPELMKRLTKEPVHSAISKSLPMLVKPVPWTGWRSGGYLSHPVPAVRLPSDAEQNYAYLRAASNSGDMAQAFAGLDVLGRTAWKINHFVFQVMVEAWNSGVAIANFQPADPKVEYPPEPDDLDDKEARRTWMRQVRLLENALQGSHSQRCYHNFQLEIAKAYLHETFYFPHSVDFRGRAYPVPPHFNHLGADHCRGLLLFAKGKPLGAVGLEWLKVHLANVFGFDKASLSERRQFTEDHIADIRDSATRPLNGLRWWLKAEDPWQCIAACMELKNALDMPDPTAFISHLPIHQDGTCNGLQHYAALGGDPIGAEQVNLEPGDRPADVYSGVADMVRARLHEKALKGSEVAKMLEGHIKRKVVKQTVMTNVYGVTFAGAIEQVKKQLRAHMIDSPSKASLPITELTLEVVSAIFQSLGTMFQGATAIQHWLVECARRISSSLSAEQIQWLEDHQLGTCKDPESPYVSYKLTKADHGRFRTSVIWTTPLKMPVVQPYRTASTGRTFNTTFQRVEFDRPSSSDAVAKKKQLQAFPPNFIHSLDATHMFLTAIKCEEVGLTFASVHDSFWTHACDINTMNRVLREAFIRLHSDDVIGRLAAEFSVRYKGYMYMMPLRLRSSVGKRITEWRQAFHRRKIGHSRNSKLRVWQVKELLEERKRLRLLASEDPQERAAGEVMVTPGRILSETQNPDEFLIPEDIPNALGSDLGDGIEAGAGGPADAAEEGAAEEDAADEDVEGMVSDAAGDLAPDAAVTEAEIEAEAEAKANVRDTISERTKMIQERKRERLRRQRENLATLVWMPMAFPAIPPKGSFDVKSLMQSQYFFS